MRIEKNAVEAFELAAVDYLLKPVNLERLSKTIHRLEESNERTTLQSSQMFPMVCCFGPLHFQWNGKQPQNIWVRWRLSKAKELFAYFVQHRQKMIPKDVLIELFWSETDLEKGLVCLNTAIYRIRKTLKSIDFNITITNYDNNYLLELNDTLLDVVQWEEGIKMLPPLSEETLSKYQEYINLYSGDYLRDIDYLWAENERARLKILWLKLVEEVAEFLLSKRQVC